MAPQCRLLTVIAGILLLSMMRQPRCETVTITPDTAGDTTTCGKCEAFIEELDEKAGSTLKTRSSSPVGFFGEGRLKLQYHDLKYYPHFMQSNRSWLQSNWEGDEGLLRLGMSINIGSSLTVNSQLGFQSTLPGNYINDPADTGIAEDTQGVAAQNRHDVHNEPAYIHDDMKAEIQLRTSLALFTVRLGGIQWIEASPLTIWKSLSRLFAWDLLPFESEEPVTIHYDENLSKKERTGRSVWNKKPFYGLGLEAIELPRDLYFDLFYGIYERYDSGERDFVDYSGDLDYTGESTEAKLRGISDSYHHVLHFRLAESNIAGQLTVGINYLGFDVRKEVINCSSFWNTFFGSKENPYARFKSNHNREGDTAFYKEPKIASFDVKGAIGKKLELQADIAMSVIDTTFVRYDSISAHEWSPPRMRASPAFYGFLKNGYGIPATLDLACIAPGFYSPFSFAAPTDAFYPFGSNLVGSGKFIARGEASPYAQNMAGALVGVSPPIGFGFCKISYGQHAQIRAARDVIFFPYRLNGQDLSSFFQTSYNRWGIGLVDASLDYRHPYNKRLGDESNASKWPDAGGLREDYPGMFEGFVPYETREQAKANMSETSTIMSPSADIPVHRKYTYNLDVDGVYDVDKLVGCQKGIFLSFYGAINGIASRPTPMALSQKDQMLWSVFIRMEPAVALSDKVYILGLAGFENWKSDNAWMKDSTGAIVRCPIDFRDIAFGAGGDWEMVKNVGLHLRLKWMKHTDVYFTKNNWETPVISLETKMVF